MATRMGTAWWSAQRRSAFEVISPRPRYPAVWRHIAQGTYISTEVRPWPRLSCRCWSRALIPQFSLGWAKVVVELNYKNGAKRITTRLPVVEVMLVVDDLFSQEMSVEILLEAQDSKGNVVGEPRPGGDVNPATRTVTLMPGQRKQIALRMDDEFRGKFSVKALNPTTLALASKDSALSLETDYTE